ncbi:MAG TPA: HAD-IA family hydrolase [Thermoanaerobaculia bacterium]|nr:HAD-IA family hydrolase [Thermoanaerobaculia bacterium]
MIEAVTFDVTHTLVHCPRLGDIYSEVLGRHGVEVAPAEALRLIGVVWREMACSADPSRDRFSAHPAGARGWWQRFLCRFCEHLEVPPPSRFAAAELFHRFGSGGAWEVYPEVPEVLDALRDRGLRLGVISNWDTRLPELLRQLDLARRFDVLVYSSAVGVEKPDSRIYRRALRELGVEPRAALHVGDSRLEDLEGAIAAGMRALLLVRGGGAPSGPSGPGGQGGPASKSARRPPARSGLHDLSPLPALVTAGAARGASR